MAALAKTSPHPRECETRLQHQRHQRGEPKPAPLQHPHQAPSCPGPNPHKQKKGMQTLHKVGHPSSPPSTRSHYGWSTQWPWKSHYPHTKWIQRKSGATKKELVIFQYKLEGEQKAGYSSWYPSPEVAARAIFSWLGSNWNSRVVLKEGKDTSFPKPQHAGGGNPHPHCISEKGCQGWEEEQEACWEGGRRTSWRKERGKEEETKKGSRGARGRWQSRGSSGKKC